jgi:hypothetical protein
MSETPMVMRALGVLSSHFFTVSMSVLFVSDGQTANALVHSALCNICPCLLVPFVPKPARGRSSFVKAIIFDGNESSFSDDLISKTKEAFPMTFICIYDPSLATNPIRRLHLFDRGANMVAHDIQSLLKVLSESVLFSGECNGSYQCPVCGLEGLSETEFWLHLPAYHINVPNERMARSCPICQRSTNKPLQVHVHEQHSPHRHSHSSTPKFYGFSLVVCRHPLTGNYLLCQEFCNQGYWVPGGAVDAGETFSTAAIRETMEEAGIDIELKGILGIDYEPHSDYVRMRVVFYAEPKDFDQLPKSIPDFESAGACWCCRGS